MEERRSFRLTTKIIVSILIQFNTFIGIQFKYFHGSNVAYLLVEFHQLYYKIPYLYLSLYHGSTYTLMSLYIYSPLTSPEKREDTHCQNRNPGKTVNLSPEKKHVLKIKMISQSSILLHEIEVLITFS